MSGHSIRRVARSPPLEVVRQRLARFVFGDQYGLTLFVGALVFFGVTWRVGFLINDNYTVANALVNLADGHFPVTDVVYGPDSGATPGMVTVDGQRFGRNYGQVALSLPVYYLLEFVAAVADLRLALVGAWCLSVLAFCLCLGRLVGRDRLFGIGGAVVALVCFFGNLTVATDLSARWTGLLALQLTSMVAAALTGVLVYRLLAAVHAQRTGLVAGVVTVAATPVGFWAAIPKRHTYMAMLVVAMLYVFYLSRIAESDTRATSFRAAAYGFVGLATWIQPAESLAMLVALVVVDVPTAPSNDRRQLAVVAGVFVVSLLPFFLTNVALSGNPLKPPRTLPRYEAVAPASDAIRPPQSSESSGIFDSSQSANDTEADGRNVVFLVVLAERLGETLIAQLTRFGSFVAAGVGALGDPDRLYHVFVRGGYLRDVAVEDGGKAINLSLVESAPVFGALVVLPQALVAHVRHTNSRSDAVVATDLLAASISFLFVLVYLPRLPLHAMVTLRYLVPMMPLLVYAVFRLQSVRALLDYPRVLAFSFAGTVFIGTQLLFVLLFVQRATLGEAVQAHALLALAVAGVFAGWLLVASSLPDRFTPFGTTVLGVVCGVTTGFLLLSGGLYFVGDGDLLLPLGRRVHEFVRWL